MKRISLSCLMLAIAIPAHASDFIVDEEIIIERGTAPIQSQIHELDAQIAAMSARVNQFDIAGTTWINPCTGLSIAECDRVSTVEIGEYAAPEDRLPLFDGDHGPEFHGPYTKTVRPVDGVRLIDGVPLWDDSVAHYLDHNFEDMFDPYQPYYIGYDANVESQIEEILTPFKPKTNLWGLGLRGGDNVEIMDAEKYAARDFGFVTERAFGATCDLPPATLTLTDGCPFETDAECEIWRRKPMINETVSPRSTEIRSDRMAIFVDAARRNPKIGAGDSAAAPFLDRYQMLMRSARACCTDGMTENLRAAGASDGLIYKFMADDANFYNIGARCLMMTDADLDANYANTATAAVAADVRNGCLCRGRQWYSAMLAPFVSAYEAVPEFAKSKFDYTYTDGLGRSVTTSINTDVKNVLNQLQMCP